jgi:hypothetical protein
LSRGGDARAALGDVGNSDFSYLDAVGGLDASSASASASDAASSALASVPSRFANRDAWYAADHRAPSAAYRASASPYAAARAARAAPATNDFAYLEANVAQEDVVGDVVPADAKRESTLGTADATAVPGDDADDKQKPKPAGDGSDELPIPGTPLDPPRDPPKDPELPRDDAEEETSSSSASSASSASESSTAAVAAVAAPVTSAADEAARAAALVAFGVESASARASGGGFVYAGGKGRCPSPSPASSKISVGAGSGPLHAFTEELGADLLFVGDSTDKLLLISGCSALLPEGERCDPAMARVGIPTTSQLPHNMRPYVAEARDVSLGYSMLGNAPRPFQTRDQAGCCVSSESSENDAADPDAGCCMTSREARTASACVAGAGAAGALHVFGPGSGLYDAASAQEDVSAYEGYGLPRSTPERVKLALESFVKWAALRRRYAKEGTFSEGGAVETELRDEEMFGTVAREETVSQLVPSRPLVVVVNSNFWPQKFWSKTATVPSEPSAPSDETPEQGAARVRKTRADDLAKYADDLSSLVRLISDEIASSSPAGGCVVLRTQHDMLGSDDPVRNARRVEGNARTRAINAAIETVGAELSVPVFPWAQIFNERLEENVFDGWCHQWGDASVYMQRRFNSWAKTHLPAECLAGSEGGAGA